MNVSTKSDAERLAATIDALLDFLHGQSDHYWDVLFERPLKELREWGNCIAAVKLLKEISFGGMGGLIDRDYGANQVQFDKLCDAYFRALRILEQRIRISTEPSGA